jgi:UDP-N-acetylglucosamine 2-epimerase (non-hydrolysing)
MTKKFYFYVGTTAELIKLAPVIKGFKKKKLDFKVIYTGQVKIDFSEFDDYIGRFHPDIKFRTKGRSSSVFKFVLWSLRTFFASLIQLRKEFSLLDKKSTYLIVHGDTVSSLIGAIVGKIFGLQIVHIESGLRSFNFFEPFPEEICRFIISKTADIHFCPNEWAVNNLSNTGGLKINTKQNTLIEIFNWSLKEAGHKRRPVKGKYFVLVVHRQEHVIFGKKKTRQIIDKIFGYAPKDIKCVFMLHGISIDFLNPILNNHKREIVYINRLSYIDYMNLFSHSEFVVTDGGSNQEELYYLGRPALIIRNVTERIEGLNINIVLGKDKEKVIKKFFMNYKTYKRKRVQLDFSPSKIIVDYM